MAEEEAPPSPGPDAPLQYGWSFFLTYPGYARAHEEDPYERLGFFDSTSTFWSNHTHFLQPTHCFCREAGPPRPKVDGSIIEGIAMFRGGVIPMWEHPENTNGGHWQATITPWDRIDDVWDAMVFGVVGNLELNNDFVTGIRFVDKSKKQRVEYRAEIWLSDYHDPFKFMGNEKWKWVSHNTKLEAFHARLSGGGTPQAPAERSEKAVEC